jgi:hypothetical protein
MTPAFIAIRPNVLLRPEPQGFGGTAKIGVPQVLAAVLLWGLLYGAVMGTSGGFAGELILASLAPFTALWYLSFENHNAAILFNGLMFAIASISSQLVLRRLYQPLIERNPRHRFLLRLWLVMYVFVGIQMAWVLRPFVGHPELPTRFLREDSWSNAYVAIARIISNFLHGLT